jgi:hypothetical protein
MSLMRPLLGIVMCRVCICSAAGHQTRAKEACDIEWHDRAGACGPAAREGGRHAREQVERQEGPGASQQKRMCERAHHEPTPQVVPVVWGKINKSRL